MLLLADVVYDPEGYEPLLLTLHAALQPAHWQALPASSPVAIMAHRSRHPDQHVRALHRQQRWRRFCSLLSRANTNSTRSFFSTASSPNSSAAAVLQNTLLPSLINALMLSPRSVRQFQAAEVRRLLHRAITRSRLLCAVVPLNPFVYITHSLQQAPQRCFIIPDIAMYEITARS